MNRSSDALHPLISERKKFLLPLAVFLFVALNLVLINVMPAKPLLLLERLFPGGGWLQVSLVSLYAAVVAFHMQDPEKSAAWRSKTWFLFSIVFFSQLLLGLFVAPVFLMTGKLHLPIPAMILAGPLYRGETSVMTLLFLSTVLLSGPAWCSHFCYFGGIDNYFSLLKKPDRGLRNKGKIKHTLLFMVIASALLLKWFRAPYWLALSAALLFGIGGLAVIVFISRRKGSMVQCITWCPIGTIVNYYKYVSPFRMYIDNECSACMLCSRHCRYDALGRDNILNHKPGLTCTLCGDCVTTCHSGSIKYRFLKMKPETSRYLYLFITISLHAITLSMARI